MRRRKIKRVLCWFSCGATSAYATWLAIQKYKNIYPIEIAYCDTGSEHQDNQRFIGDCEKLFGQEIKILKSKNFTDIWDVFQKTRYLVGINGARCTTELKKIVRRDFEELVGDLQIFGFDSSETKRSDRFKENNPEVMAEFPLLDQAKSKQDAINFLISKRIEIPVMYRLGYKNNNCIGCVKGQAGYWNKIKKDFPDVFYRMAKIERQLNVAINKTYIKGKRTKIFLDELPETMGRYDSEINLACGLICGE